MKRRARGFTIVELMVAVVIGAILVSIAIRAFGVTSSQTSARQARNVFNGMAARARAQAIESGTTTALIADATGDSVVIVANGEVVENVRFGEEMGIDIQTAAPLTLLCMNAKGYADTDCNSFSSTIKVAFVQGEQYRTLEILPLGQIRW